MPKVLSYTPSWLSRPSTGFELFTERKNASASERKSTQASPESNAQCLGPRRTIAYRGTEVFVVVGNTIRWADLCMIKDDWEAGAFSRSSRSRHEEPHSPDRGVLEEAKYKTLKVPVYEQIQQLVLSPKGDYLAIATSHTVHVAILPDSSHLEHPDTSPIRVKTHTIGPTTHVLSQARVRSALWHPLGAAGECLVTVTADAVVRLWEINRTNRWSFDSAALTVDLRKLHRAATINDDVSAAGLGAKKGFSLDALGMEVASACFGGTGRPEESGWASMTLWIAMTEGDVFALCPLLPSKWQPPSTMVPSLTTTIAARKLDKENSDSSAKAQIYNAQYSWLAEIDRQDPLMVPGESELAPHVPVYARPTIFGSVPKLQGPFHIAPGDDEDTEENDDEVDLADIYVVAPKIDMEELAGVDDELETDDGLDPGLSSTVICLVTSSGRVYVCLRLDEVEGCWLSTKKFSIQDPLDTDSQSQLMLLEALDTMAGNPEDEENIDWPTITPDIRSRYAFFLTHGKGIFFISVEPWIDPLEGELQTESTAGMAFRMDVMMKSSHALRERILRFDSYADSATSQIPAAVVLRDSDLGYFIITASADRPYAALLDSPDGAELAQTDKEEHYREQDQQIAELAIPRETYEPSEVLYGRSSLLNFLDTHVHKRHKAMLSDEIRLSSATFEVMTEAHRLLSQETHRLGVAVAEIFSRCERLQLEFRNQLDRVGEISGQIAKINDEDADDFGEDNNARGSAKIEERLRRAKDRHDDLANRHDALKRKLAKAGGRPLSDKEQAWGAEAKKLEDSIIRPENHDQEMGRKQEHWQRYEEVQDLARELIAQARTQAAAEAELDGASNNDSFKIPPDIRRNKVSQVMELLDRETALVDAAQERLERLSLSTA